MADTKVAAITAAMVKDLREFTGAGMMDCKAALTETGGDMQRPQDWLRKKGLSKAAKKAGRVAAEGLIGVLTKGTKGVVVEVNSETDFVARNEQFQGLVKMVAQVAFDVGADVEKIKAAKVGSVTVETAISDAIATIGENMSLRRAASLQSRPRRGVELCPWRCRRRRRQDGRHGCAGIGRQGRRTRWPSAASLRCMSPPQTRRRWIRPASIQNSSSAKRTSWPTNIASRASPRT